VHDDSCAFLCVGERLTDAESFYAGIIKNYLFAKKVYSSLVVVVVGDFQRTTRQGYTFPRGSWF